MLFCIVKQSGDRSISKFIYCYEYEYFVEFIESTLFGPDIQCEKSTGNSRYVYIKTESHGLHQIK